MQYDMEKWAKVATLLPDRESFQNLSLGLMKKNLYIDYYLRELRDGTPRRILDIGAGTGIFCHVCQSLGHETLAILSNVVSKRKSSQGYRTACKFLDVEAIEFTWGTERSNLDDNSFDLVNSQGMIGDNDASVWPVMLDDMLRVLKPGGTLLLAANHESGTKYKDVINNWADIANVELVQCWRKKTIWKWHKK